MLIVKCVEKDDNLTVGKEYRVKHIELHKYLVENDASEEAWYGTEIFRTVKEDKITYHGVSNPIYFMDGKEYTVLNENGNELSVVDETDEDFIYGKEIFTGINWLDDED